MKIDINIKIVVTLLLACLIFIKQTTCVAQQFATFPTFSCQGKGYSDFFLKTLHYPVSLYRDCGNSIAFITVRYQIENTGHINVLAVSGLADDSVKTYIKKSFIKTDGCWKPILVDGKKIKSKIFIQPILFRRNSGCEGKQIRIDTFEQAMHDLFAIKATSIDYTILDMWIILGINPPEQTTSPFNK